MEIRPAPARRRRGLVLRRRADRRRGRLVFGNIRLPAIVAVASGPAAGAGANVGISGIAATAAAIVHIRAGRIDWRVFAWMAPPSMVGAVVGGYASGLLPDTALLLVIGATLLYFGVRMLRPRERARRARGPAARALPAIILSGLGDRPARRPDRPDPRRAADAGAAALGRRQRPPGRRDEPRRRGLRRRRRRARAHPGRRRLGPDGDRRGRFGAGRACSARDSPAGCRSTRC